MKVTLDFDNKTVQIDGEVGFADIQHLKELLPNAEEWRLIPTVSTIGISWPYNPWPTTWQGQIWYGTYTDTTVGGSTAPQFDMLIQ